MMLPMPSPQRRYACTLPPLALPSAGQDAEPPKKWRVANVVKSVTLFSRGAAGLGGTDEPLNEEEEAVIAELTSGG